MVPRLPLALSACLAVILAAAHSQDRADSTAASRHRRSPIVPIHVRFQDGRIVFGFGSAPGGPASQDKNDQATAAAPTATTTTTTTPAPDPRARPCTTPQGGRGECRDLGACPHLLLDLANLRSSICFQQIFLPGVCCPSSDNSVNVTTAVTTTTTTRRPTTTRRSTTRRTRPTTARPSPVTTRATSPATTPAPTPQPQFSCGLPQAPQFRIVGGASARPGQWPWMAAIYLHGNGKREFWCGGSLISKQYVLTAAHCTKDSRGKSFHPRQYSVVLGDHNLRSEDDRAAPSTYTVTGYRAHPDFKLNGFYNDIALFELDREVELGEHVIPVCLPVEYEARSLDALVGTRPTVTGWGTTAYGGQEASVLQQAELPVWRQADCDRAYFQPIQEMFICAGYPDGGTDACQGDSGGPLVYFENGHWMQIGIVSFGNRCAQPGYPGVYTRITHFLPWIRQNLV